MPEANRQRARDKRGARSDFLASLECEQSGTLQIGDNRLIIGLVKRVHVRGELIDPATLRIRSDRIHPPGRMSSPHSYCRTGDRFEMRRPD